MKILVLTNLYPPHHAGSFDLRCQAVTEALAKRGHTMRVLTSNHGVGDEQRDAEIERRLLLNGVFDHPAVTGFRELRALETRNRARFLDAVAEFQPDLVHVFSLHGLSKSLLFTLRDARLPVVFDVADDWLAAGIRQDPWLRWWNRPQAPFLSGAWRRLLEITGQRAKIDAEAPTRMMPAYERMPEVYGPPETLEHLQPESVSGFRFYVLYFCSRTLKEKAVRAGFQVHHSEVIYPCVPTEQFVGQVKPQSAAVKKLLIVAPLIPPSGVKTALEALRIARQHKLAVTLGVYGRGESDYVAQLRSFVVTHQLPVEFLTVSNLTRDLAAIYRQHDAFLHTSESEESFPTTPLEAMASGLPVIATAVGATAELFRHGENAFTYTPGNAAELASRIHELLLQPALRCQVAETAQAEVLSRFNESVVLDQIENYLQGACQLWQQA